MKSKDKVVKRLQSAPSRLLCHKPLLHIRRSRATAKMTTKDAPVDVVMEDAEPTPTRNEAHQMPLLEAFDKAAEKLLSSVLSLKEDFEEEIQRQRNFLRSSLNHVSSVDANRLEDERTQAHTEPIDQRGLSPLNRDGDQPDLPSIVDHAIDITNSQSGVNDSSGDSQRENSATASWNDRTAAGDLGFNRYIARPSVFNPFAVRQTCGNRPESPRHRRAESAPLILGKIDENTPAVQSTEEQANLFIIQDGHYVSPEYMKGVPFDKLVEGSEYWRETWPTIEGWIKGSEAAWVFDTVRYWKEHPIHPNQLISIDYLDDLGLCSAEMPRILQLTLEDLKAGQVTHPLRWLRKRLGDIIAEYKKDDKNFSLKSVLKRFRAHDTEFRRYHRVRKTRARVNDGPNDTEATSVKRAHAEEDGEPSSARPTKKVHGASSDATLTEVHQNGQIMLKKSGKK